MCCSSSVTRRTSYKLPTQAIARPFFRNEREKSTIFFDMLTNVSHCGNFEPTFPVRIIRIVFLSVIFLVSLVGNTLIIIVVYKRPELRKTVNYFIVNMAVSDFFFPLMAIPTKLGETTAGSWEWRGNNNTAAKILCKISSLIIPFSVTVSIESLVWIAFDRFIAVVWPMKIRLISPRFRAFALASTWIVAVAINCQDLYLFDLMEQNGKVRCHADSSSLVLTVSTYLRAVLIYIAPMILLTILYSVIVVNLRRRHTMLQCNTAQRNDHKKQQAVKMSLCIVVLFYLFFLPFAIALIFWRTPVSKSCSFFKHFYLFASSALYISSTTNPIVCFIFVESFRRGLSEVFNFYQCKRFRTSTALVTEGREKIILKRIKVISGIENNLEFNDT